MNKAEREIKQERILALLEERQLDALWLRRASSFAWATGGVDAHINTADSEGVASLLIGKDFKAVITNNIEAPRLEQETDLKKQGWDFWSAPWYSPGREDLDEKVRGMRLGVDLPSPDATDLGPELAEIRAQLTPEEVERFRSLASDCAAGMWEAIGKLKPGLSEIEIGALQVEAVERRGVQAIVNLIATDERIFQFRHPLPTVKKLGRYAMLILCGRRQGLVCSVTRLVYFGHSPEELRQKMDAVAQVDAEIIAATRPGRTLGNVFEQAQASYAAVGFPDEWRRHHQGGLAGYEPREVTAIPGSPQPIQVNQVFAWNPSISGVKCEDSILVGAEANEVLTRMDAWPVQELQLGGQTISRPVILEVD